MQQIETASATNTTHAMLRTKQRLRWLSGLQAYMAFSYVRVTMLSVLLLAILELAIIFLSTTTAFQDRITPLVRPAAQQIAQVIASQTQGTELDHYTTFVLSAPMILASGNSAGLTLLFARNGQIRGSSDPLHYPLGTSSSDWLPERTSCLTRATSAETASAIYTTSTGRIVCALAPVKNRQQQAIGTIYIQVLELPQRAANIWQTASDYAPWGLLFLVLTLPIGAVFGMISTRGLVQRIRRLVVATTQFAEGHYAQHVLITQNDEVSQLEYHFNRMAEQLAEGIVRRQELAEHSARLEERARISRELHDAISQDLFSLRTLTDGLQIAIQAGAQMVDCQPRIAMLEQTTNAMTREMRALLLEMRPPQLEGLGLAEALEVLADAYTLRLGITVTTSIAPITLSILAEQSLLRIAQEALTNAARHTNATMITLTLAQKEQIVSLRISDNGQGFKRDESDKQHGLGLHLMQERVEELHGSFLLDTIPGKGTRIDICVPQEAQG